MIDFTTITVKIIINALVILFYKIILIVLFFLIFKMIAIFIINYKYSNHFKFIVLFFY